MPKDAQDLADLHSLAETMVTKAQKTGFVVVRIYEVTVIATPGDDPKVIVQEIMRGVAKLG